MAIAVSTCFQSLTLLRDKNTDESSVFFPKNSKFRLIITEWLLIAQKEFGVYLLRRDSSFQKDKKESDTKLFFTS